jgi:hypothetical protein
MHDSMRVCFAPGLEEPADAQVNNPVFG